MKIAFRILSLLILVVVSTFYAGCKKDDEDPDTLEKKQLDKLAGDWTLQSASDDVGTRTEDFSGLVLHVQGNYVEGGTYNYSLTGSRPDPSPWPENGTWKFGTDKATEIIRDPGGVNEIKMFYQMTETELILEFTVPDGSAGWPGTGRIKKVIGEWTFTFSK